MQLCAARHAKTSLFPRQPKLLLLRVRRKGERGKSLLHGAAARRPPTSGSIRASCRHHHGSITSPPLLQTLFPPHRHDPFMLLAEAPAPMSNPGRLSLSCLAQRRMLRTPTPAGRRCATSSFASAALPRPRRRGCFLLPLLLLLQQGRRHRPHRLLPLRRLQVRRHPRQEVPRPPERTSRSGPVASRPEAPCSATAAEGSKRITITARKR